MHIFKKISLFGVDNYTEIVYTFNCEREKGFFLTKNYTRTVYRRLGMENKILTSQEVADLLGFKKRTIQKWVREGYIPYLKLGGKTIRFLEADLDNWLANHQKGGKCA